MTKNWQLLSQITPATSSQAIDILLKNRGIEDSQVQEFISPAFPSDLPLEKSGLTRDQITQAVQLILSHVNLNHKIAIYGDYDVDGVCSTAILWETLYKFYTNVFPHIPHRESEGYGLSQKGIDHCLSQGAKLIITVDNGIVAHNQTKYCRDQGCDIIIIDHHEPGEILPEPNVLLHSKLSCAAGLTWIFCRESIPLLQDSPTPKIVNSDIYSQLQDQLALVATAVICDMVPLLGINRSFAKCGLEQLNHTFRVGLKALFAQANLTQGKLGPYEVGFVIGPRINAMGRLEHAIDSLRLICTPNSTQAQSLALLLDQTNRSRQDLTESSVTHALNLIAQKYPQKMPKLLIAYDKTYSPGIIGLIAAKLVEKYHRPAIALSVGETVCKASARSVSGFDITSHIRSAQDLLLEVGGHSMAAGFAVATDKLEKLVNLLVNAAEKKITDNLLQKTIKIDCELPQNLINIDFLYEISRLAPFGLGNPEPVFLNKKLLLVDSRLVGKDNKHLKLTLASSIESYSAIAFGLGEMQSKLVKNQPLTIAFSLSQNNFNGPSLELKIKDISLI